MKIALENKTHWRDDHIRAFLSPLIKEERPDLCKRGASALRVVVVYTRYGGQGSSGCAGLKLNWMKVRLPKHGPPDKIDFAHSIAHELAHTRGMTHGHGMNGPVRSRRELASDLRLGGSTSFGDQGEEGHAHHA